MMESKNIRMERYLAEAIQQTAHTLRVPTSHASVIVFFGLHKKSIWDKTFPEAKVNMIRKDAIKKIAMGLTL